MSNVSNQFNQVIEPNPPYESPKLPPLTANDLKGDSLFGIDQETLQFQADVINVFENRVDIKEFDSDYRQRLKNYYRFAPVFPSTMGAAIASKSATRSGKG